jgi:ankyrin repeat protein
MVRALMAIPGINYEAATVGGETPLICAIESGNKRTLAECLNRGFNPFVFTNFLMTPLDFARKFPNVDSQDFVLLVTRAQEQWLNQLPI